MQLDSDQILSVKNLIRSDIEKADKAANDRLLAVSAIVGVMLTALLGVSAWGLHSAHDEARESAINAAKDEDQRYFYNATVVNDFQHLRTTAEDQALKATAEATSASTAAESSRNTLTNIREQLAEKDNIIQALRNIDKLTSDLAKNHDFQNGVYSLIKKTAMQ